MSKKRPWELLPIIAPSEFDPGPNFFYENIVKELIPCAIRIMVNGIHIDQKAVEELRTTLDNVLENVETMLAKNPIIREFQEYMLPLNKKEYLAEMETKKKTRGDFIKPFKDGNKIHRTYLVNTILRYENKELDCRDDWSANDLKKYCTFNSSENLRYVVDKTYEPIASLVDCAMVSLAFDKMEIYNKSHYHDKVNSKTREDFVQPFNPGSTKQLRELFDYLKVEPLAFSDKTGEPSWGRPQIEELFHTAEDGPYKDLLQLFIDHSFSAIVRNNFIEGFDKFIVDGVLHGNIKLFGAKTMRNTSNSPNLLNAPSTGSIYAKPLKKCFIAPKGFLVASVDFGQLEDRVVANLTKDEGKCNIFLEDLDSHCFNALGYFPDKIAKHMKLTGDKVVDAKAFKAEVEAGNKELKAIRQEGKPCTFGIVYGSHPPKIASTIKCSLTEAEQIFDGYHNTLYKGITRFREDVILKKAKEDGYVHMGLGCRIYSDDIDKDSRTLWNSISQFWSILTLIAINELHYQIDEAGYSNDIEITSTIYDSIYFNVRNDAKVIKWLNDTLIPIMTKDWLIDSLIPNTASLCIGTSWANVEDNELPIDATIEQIQGVLDDIKS